MTSIRRVCQEPVTGSTTRGVVEGLGRPRLLRGLVELLGHQLHRREAVADHVRHPGQARVAGGLGEVRRTTDHVVEVVEGRGQLRDQGLEPVHRLGAQGSVDDGHPQLGELVQEGQVAL